MKTPLLGLLILILTLSGCTQTTPTGQAILQTQEQPDKLELESTTTTWKEPTHFKTKQQTLPNITLEELQEFLDEDPFEFEPKETHVLIDKCEYTWDLSIPLKEYKDCYNDNYILKVNKNTTIEFCKEIGIPEFSSKCFKELAWEQKDPSICEQALGTIEFKGAIENYETSTADYCYYLYELNYGSYLEDTERNALCETIQNKQLNFTCFKNILISKNQGKFN